MSEILLSTGADLNGKNLANAADVYFSGKLLKAGSHALHFTGTTSVYLGVSAGTLITTATDNVASGSQALGNVTTGGGNIAYGSRSLLSNDTGANNVAIGSEAGYTATPANANLSGSNNVWIGHQAGPGTSTQLTNSIAIGYQATVSASNKIQLGGDSMAFGFSDAWEIDSSKHLIPTTTLEKNVGSSSRRIATTFTQVVDASGRGSFGNNSLYPYSMVLGYKNSGFSSGSQYGVYGFTRGAGTVFNGALQAVSGELQLAHATGTYSGLGVALYGKVVNATGNVTNLYGTYTDLTNTGGTITNYYSNYATNGNSASPATITNHYGYYLTHGGPAGNNITNTYGLYVTGLKGTNKYGVYIEDANALSYFGAQVTFNKNIVMTTASLLGSPPTGAIEFDGTRFYGTPSTGRKTLAYTSDIGSLGPATINYVGKRSNNVGHSSKSNLGYAPLTIGGHDAYSGTIFAGTATGKTFTRTTGTWGDNSEADRYYLVYSASNSQVLKVKSNTTTVLTFYDDVYVSSVTNAQSLTSDLNWPAPDKYVDTGFTGTSFADTLFDGQFLWMIPADTETKIYKIDVSSGVVTTINHGLTATSLISLVFDGYFVWAINGAGGNHLRINPRTNTTTLVGNTLTGCKTGIFDGKYIWVFGFNGSTFAYNRYSIVDMSVTNYTYATNNGKTVYSILRMPMYQTKLYIVAHNGTNIYIHSLDTSTDTWSTALFTGSSLPVPESVFDGSNIIMLSNGYLTRYNVVTGVGQFESSQGGIPTYGNATFTGEVVLITTNGVAANGSDLYYFDPNTAYPGTPFATTNRNGNWRLGNTYKLYYAGDWLYQWGGRYFARISLPKAGYGKKYIQEGQDNTFIENGVRNKWLSISADYSIEFRDYGLLIDTSAARAMTLPDATRCKGQTFKLKDDTGSMQINNVTVSTSLSQTIDNSGTSMVLNTNWAEYSFTSNGSNWRVTSITTSGGGGGISWSEVIGTTQAMIVDTGYITNNAAQVVCTLPDTAAVGKVVRIAGKGAGGWKLAQNTGEIIHFGNLDTTTGTGGYVESTHRRDAVELVCVVADTEWNVISSVGNITIV